MMIWKKVERTSDTLELGGAQRIQKREHTKLEKQKNVLYESSRPKHG